MSFFFFLGITYHKKKIYNGKKMCVLLWQVIFITEYMSSGSLKQFLKKTKKNHKTMNEKVTRRSPVSDLFSFPLTSGKLLVCRRGTVIS